MEVMIYGLICYGVGYGLGYLLGVRHGARGLRHLEGQQVTVIADGAQRMDER